ncbi:putative HD-like signal output (HDOD) domain, no enzymatic activity [Gammaproteobacteria bacterium]
MTIQTFDENTTAQLLKGIDIPPQPKILLLVMEEQQRFDPDLRKIARAVEKDVGLAVAMLRAANSPAFGLGRKVTSISQSVMLLGMNNSANLITGLSLRTAMSSASRISFSRFWDMAADTALICSALARRFKIMAADQAHMMGLFHDCGIPLMMQKFSNYAEDFIKFHTDSQGLLINLEEQHFNTNHALVGYFVARSWCLPEEIRTAIFNHHDEDLLTNAADSLLARQVALLSLANHLCHLYHWENDSAEWSRIEEGTLRVFDLNGEELMEIIDDMKDVLATA